MNIDQSGARRAYRAQGSTPGIAQFTRFLISTSYALPSILRWLLRPCSRCAVRSHARAQFLFLLLSLSLSFSQSSVSSDEAKITSSRISSTNDTDEKTLYNLRSARSSVAN